MVLWGTVPCSVNDATSVQRQYLSTLHVEGEFELHAMLELCGNVRLDNAKHAASLQLSQVLFRTTVVHD